MVQAQLGGEKVEYHLLMMIVAGKRRIEESYPCFFKMRILVRAPHVIWLYQPSVSQV